MNPTASVHQILYKPREMCEGDRENNETSIRGRKHESYTVLECYARFGIDRRRRDR
jgi:hypothetical protein